MTSTLKKLGIFGAGGHAKVVADTAWRGSEYVPTAFYDDDTARHHQIHYRGLEIRGGFEDLLSDLRQGLMDAAFIAIGNNEIRVVLGERVLDGGFHLATLVDPHAILSPTVILNAGTLVVAGAKINADTRIGSHVIINTSAIVDHDCMIDHGVHVAPNAALCGGVVIGKHTLISVGSILIPGISFPEYSILGAGAVSLNDETNPGVYIGTPSRRITK